MIASIAIVRVLEWTPGTAGIGWMVIAWTWNVRSGIRWVSPDPAGVSSNVYGLFIYSLYACIHTYIIITQRAPHYACMHAFIHIYYYQCQRAPDYRVTGRTQPGESLLIQLVFHQKFMDGSFTYCMHAFIHILLSMSKGPQLPCYRNDPTWKSRYGPSLWTWLIMFRSGRVHTRSSVCAADT